MVKCAACEKAAYRRVVAPMEWGEALVCPSCAAKRMARLQHESPAWAAKMRERYPNAANALVLPREKIRRRARREPRGSDW
jgi:DNA-directed RNA polymerase subunit RPC12/RpoP